MMDIVKIYEVLGRSKAVNIITYINYNECSFTSISENCNIKSGQLTKLLKEMCKLNILNKKTMTDRTLYTLSELGLIILKHMLEIRAYTPITNR
jgi:predicted transcriptional regulator